MAHKKSIKLEVTIKFDDENFLQTEENTMNKVNEIGQKATQSNGEFRYKREDNSNKWKEVIPKKN